MKWELDIDSGIFIYPSYYYLNITEIELNVIIIEKRMMRLNYSKIEINLLTSIKIVLFNYKEHKFLLGEDT